MDEPIRVVSWARFLFAVVLIVIIASFGFIHRHRLIRLYHQMFSRESAAAPLVGQSLPSLTFSNLDGGTTTLAPRPGHMLFVEVFTTWCPSCVKEAPALEQFRNQVAQQAVDVVGIDQQENPAKISRFISNHGINFPILIDDQHLTENIFGVHFIPAVFVVDDHGIIRAKHLGAMSLAQMQEMIHGVRMGTAYRRT